MLQKLKFSLLHWVRFSLKNLIPGPASASSKSVDSFRSPVRHFGSMITSGVHQKRAYVTASSYPGLCRIWCCVVVHCSEVKVLMCCTLLCTCSWDLSVGVGYKLQEDGIQSQRFSWLQLSEGSSELLQSKGFRDIVTLRCRNLPYVGQLLVDESGRFTIPSPVCPVLHKLRDGAQARGASRPASKFIDGSPCLAARVREVDGVDRFLPSLWLLFKSR